ncbi:serine/threonine protein phosphatase [Microbulbifer spongiae]|uniref:Metallophosphoesterase n=1 Tax=Microbulbifer spongiae TaxID=2944933 RepID=A0ABY9EDD7_9GAMM|nr:serine/threonine protein phosphatase [Microbulbifer sp. MI-G]WKD51038.1 metallophosphoesterase [Microbulbifer sp. MI-G]
MTTNERLIAIGDIHGCYSHLTCLIDQIQPTEHDLLVFLGDYIDRGPDSRAVIDYCFSLKDRYPCVFIKGNHEEMLLASLEDEAYFNYWMQYGGDKTLESYGLPLKTSSVTQIPDEHIEFMAQCLDYYETDDFIFSHAQPNPEKSMDQQTAEELRWEHREIETLHCTTKPVIYGHTTQRNSQVRALSSGWGIDTYAHGGGWLTALVLPQGEVIQVNQFSEVKKSRVPSVQL